MKLVQAVEGNVPEAPAGFGLHWTNDDKVAKLVLHATFIRTRSIQGEEPVREEFAQDMFTIASIELFASLTKPSEFTVAFHPGQIVLVGDSLAEAEVEAIKWAKTLFGGLHNMKVPVEIPEYNFVRGQKIAAGYTPLSASAD